MDRAKARILVLEGDPLVRNFVARVLTGNGYEVLEAARPDDAFKICESFEGDIDLLLLDRSFSRLIGPEIEKRVLQSRPHLNIVQMSGWPAGLLAQECGIEEADFLLQKPFSHRDILQMVEGVLQKSQHQKKRYSHGYQN